MSSSKKSYDAEFKREAVRLADNSDKGDSTIERDLGLYQGAIRTWRKALRPDPETAFHGTGRMKPAEIYCPQDNNLSGQAGSVF